MLYPEPTYPRNGKAFPSALGWGFRNVSRSNHRIPGMKIGKHDRYQWLRHLRYKRFPLAWGQLETRRQSTVEFKSYICTMYIRTLCKSSEFNWFTEIYSEQFPRVSKYHKFATTSHSYTYHLDYLQCFLVHEWILFISSCLNLHNFTGSFTKSWEISISSDWGSGFGNLTC